MTKMAKIKTQVLEGTRKWFAEDANYKDLSEARAVLGISGGKDSSVVAAILCEALGKDHVYGVMMPNGEQKDLDDSYALCDFLGLEKHYVNIGPAFEEILGAIDCNSDLRGVKESDAVMTNLPARLRMATLYAIANKINGRVIGTGNKAESVVGYFTLFGDGAHDFNPIADLFVDEVIQLGTELGLPDRFTRKIPNDGMSGMPDEEKLGFSYADVKLFYNNPYVVAVKELGQEKFDKINSKFKGTDFKRRILNIPNPTKYNLIGS